MYLEFEMEQGNKTLVKIIATHENERKEVGRIFTPSGTGHDNLNAIQICGFTEAFDLWGCSEYQTFKRDPNGVEYAREKPIQYNIPYQLLDILDEESKSKLISSIRKANMDLHKEKKEDRIRIQCKDVQLKFPFPSESFKSPNTIMQSDKWCWRCFNYPCTCENKGKNSNPYDVKREEDLFIPKLHETVARRLKA